MNARVSPEPGSTVADPAREEAPVISISSSLDEELGDLRAPLDATLRGEQVSAIVWRALDLDSSPKSLRAVVKPGSWVVVKPNIVTSPGTPDCSYWYEGRAHPGQNTDLRVVKAVVDYLLSNCRPRRVTIAEGGAEWRKLGEPDTEPGVIDDGWTVRWPEYDGLSYAGLVATWEEFHPGLVDIVDLNYDEFRFAPVPDPRGSGIGALQRQGAKQRPADRFGRGCYLEGTGSLREGYRIPATVLDCDVLICCPAMKVHMGPGTSLVLKNYVGISAPNPARRNYKSDAHQGDINRGVVDLYSYHPADYAVVEGFFGTEGNGPQWGDDVQHNVVIVGGDAVAVDAVSSTVMGYNPEDLECLQLAALKRLGETDVRRVEVVGKSIAEVSRLYRLGRGKSGFYFSGRGLRDWLIAPIADTGSEAGEWTRVSSDGRYVDLDHHLGPEALDAAWAFAEIDCEQALEAEVWLAADGPATLYRLGEPVIELVPADGHHLGEATRSLSLPQERTGLLLKVTRGAAGFGFSMLICDQPGALPLGVHICRPDEATAAAAVAARRD